MNPTCILSGVPLQGHSRTKSSKARHGMPLERHVCFAYLDFYQIQ